VKQIQDAYIVAATRSPIGRSHRGVLRNMRPDDLLATVLKSAMAQVPGLDPQAVEDIICGCAIPEGPQGLNVARIAAVLAGLPKSVGGITVNRFCASGPGRGADGPDRIRVGEADVMIAAGTESMSMVPMMGNTPVAVARPSSPTRRHRSYGIAYGMGLTGREGRAAVEGRREAQDEFAYASHMKADARR
jgi:acetyl-CoA acyltransferase